VSAGDGWESVGHQLSKELKKIKTGPERVAFVKGRISMLPEDQRDKVEQFVVAVMFASKDDSVVNEAAPGKWEKPAAVGFGIAFMVGLLALAIFVPHPTPFQYEVFRIVLSVGVAGFAACIPGLINVRLGGAIQATGALAVFAVVYFYNPAKLVVDHSAPTPTTEPTKLPSRAPG
jgi:hypothetical protein